MSWQATADVKRLKEGITRTEKLVLMMLADYHNEKTGQCNPRVSDLAEDALMSVRRVQQVLTALETRKLLAIENREGGRLKTQYWLLCIGDTPEKYSPLQPQKVSPHPRSPLHPTPEARFTPPPKSSDSQPPLTVIEPKEEEQELDHDHSLILNSSSVDPWQGMRGAFEDVLGLAGGTIVEEARDYARIVPALWFTQALELTRQYADRPSWKYCKAILDRSLTEQLPPVREKRHRGTEPAQGSAQAQFMQRHTALLGGQK